MTESIDSSDIRASKATAPWIQAALQKGYLKGPYELVEVPLGARIETIEEIVILATLEKFKFNRTRTAKALGIGVRTLQRRLKAYEFNEPDTSYDENELTDLSKLTTTSSSPEMG